MRTCYFIALAAVLALSSPAWSRIGGGDITYSGRGAGSVVFSHSSHVGKTRLNCMECHRITATAKINGRTGMKDMKNGAFCGVCHDGQTAFGVTDNCARCHHK